ncbi:MAG TPA: HAD family phosphatase [Candidatus Limnocylindria bacterium]
MASLSRPGAILLDLDGTLVDTVGTRIEAWLRTFAEFEIPADREQVAALIGSDGKHLAREVSGSAGRPVDDELAEQIDKRSGEIYSELNTDPRRLPGVGAFLDAVEAQGIPWSIATSSRREQTGRSVAALGRATEPRMVDGSSVERAKPAPDLMLAAARELAVPPDQCWCVGDSTWDMRAAAAAGMTPVAVLAGSAIAPHDLREAGAVACVAQLDNLIPALS